MTNKNSEGFQSVARELISDLRRVRGDEQAEKAALQKAVDGLVQLHRANGDETPLEELMIPERLGEDTLEDHRSVIDFAADDDEDVEFRLREMLCDLCGY